MPRLARADATEAELQEKIGGALRAAAAPLSRQDVEEILVNLIGGMSGDLSALDLKLYRELEALADFIQSTKAEVEAIRPHDIRHEHIPTATDQLDAVIGATEEATHQIMDACDAIGALANDLEAGPRAVLVDQVTRIFEACNFQDVTGQRITKVVTALRHIETKVDALLRVFGEGADGRAAIVAPAAAADAAHPVTDADLLHGPQLPGQGIDQDEIDRLLASFD